MRSRPVRSSERDCFSPALWRGHNWELAARLEERHWRPEGERYWQRGAESEAGIAALSVVGVIWESPFIEADEQFLPPLLFAGEARPPFDVLAVRAGYLAARGAGAPPPPVFFRKSLEEKENRDLSILGSATRVRKCMKIRR